jgi:hypothetical protein
MEDVDIQAGHGNPLVMAELYAWVPNGGEPDGNRGFALSDSRACSTGLVSVRDPFLALS